VPNPYAVRHVTHVAEAPPSRDYALTALKPEPEICFVSLRCARSTGVPCSAMSREEIDTEYFPCTRLQSQPPASVNGRKIPEPRCFFGSLHIVSSLVTYHQASSLTLQRRTVPPTQIASVLRYAQFAVYTQEIGPLFIPNTFHPWRYGLQSLGFLSITC
jgi:hypothetical protein